MSLIVTLKSRTKLEKIEIEIILETSGIYIAKTGLTR